MRLYTFERYELVVVDIDVDVEVAWVRDSLQMQVTMYIAETTTEFVGMYWGVR